MKEKKKSHAITSDNNNVLCAVFFFCAFCIWVSMCQHFWSMLWCKCSALWDGCDFLKEMERNRGKDGGLFVIQPRYNIWWSCNRGVNHNASICFVFRYDFCRPFVIEVWDLPPGFFQTSPALWGLIEIEERVLSRRDPMRVASVG